MKRYVSPRVSCRSRIKFATWAAMETSRAERGSSATMSLGSRASTRAIETRRFSPPERSGGYAESFAGLSLTSERRSSDRRRTPENASGSRSIIGLRHSGCQSWFEVVHLRRDCRSGQAESLVNSHFPFEDAASRVYRCV